MVAEATFCSLSHRENITYIPVVYNNNMVRKEDTVINLCKNRTSMQFYPITILKLYMFLDANMMFQWWVALHIFLCLHLLFSHGLPYTLFPNTARGMWDVRSPRFLSWIWCTLVVNYGTL